MAELTTRSAALFDPLDLQDLWSITTDLVNATHSTVASICALASFLAEDTEADAAPVRQQLLEIRARLVYILEDVAYSVITHTSTLASSGAMIISEHLHQDPPPGVLAVLESQWAAVLRSCVTNHDSVCECISAWASISQNLSDFRRLRARSSRPVSSFLRALRVFGPEPASPNHVMDPPHEPVPESSVQSNLESIGESLTLIEAFWRKRQALFQSPDECYSRERLARSYDSWSKLGGGYTTFNRLLDTCTASLTSPEPRISYHADIQTDPTKSPVGWRALIAT